VAQFIVLQVSNSDVPSLGQAGSADVYRGDHLTEQEAVNAAALVLRTGVGRRLWVVPGTALTRYVVSANASPG
jgi:hypothetical protein